MLHLLIHFFDSTHSRWRWALLVPIILFVLVEL